MMACSITVQAANLWALRKSIRWKQSLVLVVGGLLGVPIAVWLLQAADARIFREGFGLAIACYAAYTLFRPVLSHRLRMNVGRNAIVGFVGGLTAMPGAVPTIWCDIHGVPKTEQRALIQPFIAAIQIFSLVLMLLQNDLSSKVLVEFVASIPALLAGAALGIFAFRCALRQPVDRRRCTPGQRDVCFHPHSEHCARGRTCRLRGHKRTT